MILTWAERCEKFDDGEIITERLIQEVMQEEIDELREQLEETRQLYIKQLALNEDRDSAIHVTGYWKGIEYKRLRELTDEEIVQIYKETEADNGWLREFVKAILAKACK
jgi:hypothetical protein